MCLLTFLPAGVQPNLDHLHVGAVHNPHGHGYAIVTGHRLLTGRGLDPDAVIDRFARHRAAHPHGPAVFHSRWCTHGRVDLANCHPLRIGRDRRTVLAHNGILPAEVHPRRGDRRSDTRIAADEFIPRLGPLHRPATRARLQRWAGPGNKIVILTVDPAFDRNAYLLNEQQGIWQDRIWYSNDDFRLDPDIDTCMDPVICPHCGGTTPAVDDLCWVCGACWDCGEGAERCFCYTPARLDHQPSATAAPLDDDTGADNRFAAWWSVPAGERPPPSAPGSPPRR
jgi:glutamine amidotransferase